MELARRWCINFNNDKQEWTMPRKSQEFITPLDYYTTSQNFMYSNSTSAFCQTLCVKLNLGLAVPKDLSRRKITSERTIRVDGRSKDQWRFDTYSEKRSHTLAGTSDELKKWITRACSWNEPIGQPVPMIYNSISASEVGIFLWGRAFHSFTKRRGKLFFFLRELLIFLCGADTDDKSTKPDASICIGVRTCPVFLSSFPPFFALLQRFSEHTVYLSWHIQSMNWWSQQVWTQLLNIQDCTPPLAFSHDDRPHPP